MKRPAPIDSFDDSFDDVSQDEALFTGSTSTNLPFTQRSAFRPVDKKVVNPPSTLAATSSKPQQSVFKPPPPKQAFKPTQTIQINTFKNVNVNSTVVRPNAPTGLQQQVRPHGSVGNAAPRLGAPFRPPVPSQVPLRPVGGLPNSGSTTSQRPITSGVNQFQRSTSFPHPSQNQPRPGGTAQQRPNGSVMNQNARQSQPQFHQSFRPPGCILPQAQNAFRQQNTTVSSVASQFQRTQSFPGPSGQNQMRQANPRQPIPLNSQYRPNAPNQMQQQQQQPRQMTPFQQQQQKFFAASQKNARFPMQTVHNQPRLSTPQQQQQRPLQPSQMNQRFPTRPPTTVPRLPGSIQRQPRPFAPPRPAVVLGTATQTPSSSDSGSPVVAYSQSVQNEITRLKADIRFWEVKCKGKDRDHNLLAMKLRDEQTTKTDITTELQRLKEKNEQLNEQHLKEQMEKEALKAALAAAEAAVAAAVSQKPMPSFPAPTIVKAKFPPSIEDVKADGQQGSSSSVNFLDRLRSGNSNAPSTKKIATGVSKYWTYKKERDFLFQKSNDILEPDAKLNNLLDKYRVFFNLERCKRIDNEVVPPPGSFGYVSDSDESETDKLLVGAEPVVKEKKKKKKKKKKKSKKPEPPRSPSPVFGWTPILDLEAMKRPRVLRPYEKRELAEAEARRKAEEEAKQQGVTLDEANGNDKNSEKGPKTGNSK